MTKWENISNKRSYTHLSYSHFRPSSISLSYVVPMGIPREGWEYRISHSHTRLNLMYKPTKNFSSSQQNFLSQTYRLRKLLLSL